MSKGIYRTMHLKNIDTNKLIKIIGKKLMIHKNKITRQNGVFLKNTFWLTLENKGTIFIISINSNIRVM